MYPSLEYVLTKRYFIGVLLRGVALVLFVFGAVPVLQMVFDAVLNPLDPRVRAGLRPRVNWTEMLLVQMRAALVYILPALVLLYFQQRIVRWLAPMPKPRCPECGYWIKRGGRPQCPECGAALPRALVERGDEP